MDRSRQLLSRTLVSACALAAASAGAELIGEPSGTGPHPAVAESRLELPGHTVYRPAVFPPEPMPLFVWGNGGCSNNGFAHAAYLRQVASHGYFVVSLGVPTAAGGAATPAPARQPAPAAASEAVDPTQAEQMLEAIDWAERETARAGGDFFRRIDVTRVAVGGHSCGGLQALAVSNDARVDTTLVLNSGIYITPGGRSRVRIDKTQLERLHGPMLYLTGGPSDIAHANAVDDVERIDRVPVFFGALPVGHGGTFAAANGGEWASVSSRWLDWQLKSNADASRDFAGADCLLCKDERWSIVQKQLSSPVPSPRED